ncbi:MAG: Limonene,2-epoxide hydrolase [Nocardioides sp.]|jgi:limonene-1,2-epoxide hydrolase|nr:Limonene,2-epoxide hydrolase [Nocardioides sp.]
MTPEGPEQIVRVFLERLAAADVDGALELLDPEVVWKNTAMPAFRGERARGMLRDMKQRGIGFGVQWHHVAANGDVVLTDRTDVIKAGSWETSFRVRGTFEVRDGRIVLWDDSFSWLELLESGVVGLGRMLTSR